MPDFKDDRVKKIRFILVDDNYKEMLDCSYNEETITEIFDFLNQSATTGHGMTIGGGQTTTYGGGMTMMGGGGTTVGGGHASSYSRSSTTSFGGGEESQHTYMKQTYTRTTSQHSNN